MNWAPMTSSPSKSSTTASSPLRASSPLKKSPSKSSPTKPTTDTNRPSAEDLVDLERELNRLIARKTAAEASLVTLEGRLYDLETEYLTETAPFGNLIHGLEGYLGLSTTTGGGSGNTTTTPGNNRRSAFASGAANIASMASSGIPLSQRLFSATSTTFGESLALLGRREEAVAAGYVPEADSGSASSKNNKPSSNGLKNIPGLVKSSDQKGAGSTTSNNHNKKKKTTTTQSSTTSNNNSSSKKSEPTWTPPPMKARKK